MEVITGPIEISAPEVKPPQKTVTEGILERISKYGKYGVGNIPLPFLEGC